MGFPAERSGPHVEGEWSWVFREAMREVQSVRFTEQEVVRTEARSAMEKEKLRLRKLIWNTLRR